ncbi:LTA synthase family protein [Schwartzia succinivorans]|uniref:LTA synthase family protein n=1 Tax=Schwartzia succinivorans TaxID=55507 RepID=UPI002352A9EA|nr:sulfatase-like hydrolase/transferase [Schwartzia succinivorans]
MNGLDADGAEIGEIKLRHILFGIVLTVIFFGSIFVSGQSLSEFTLPFIAKHLLQVGCEIACVLFILAVGEHYTCDSKWKHLWTLFSIVFIVGYLSECFYWALTTEWITPLALENLNQAYLLLDSSYLLPAAGVILVVWIYIKYVSTEKVFDVSVENEKKAASAALVIFLMFAFGVVLQNTHLGRYFGLKRGYPSPMVSLAENSYKVLFPGMMKIDTTEEYPFEKEWVYQAKCPFPALKKEAEKPNVIVIFTEGTSARLLETYGGGYSDLTPNIDDFAKHSMKVDNYFNHTAATFRGTLGQLSSCYPYAGGGEAVGWTKRADELKGRNYQTLPKLLNGTFDTVFISPHSENDPYTTLLQNVGFQQIITRESCESFLGYKPEIHSSSIKDNDMYKTLISFLEKRKTDDKPLFLAMYTFATHTGIKIPEDGIPYVMENGKRNMVLDSLHTCDAAFGEFWRWFQKSAYKDNTIVIFTADHAHYNDSPFMELVKNEPDYTKCFVDRIPLLIYDPTHQLPKTYDANDKTSITLAPTIYQLLEMNPNVKNSFMGGSLFDDDSEEIHVAALGKTFIGIYGHKAYDEYDIEDSNREVFYEKKENIYKFYSYEFVNRIFH